MDPSRKCQVRHPFLKLVRASRMRRVDSTGHTKPVCAAASAVRVGWHRGRSGENVRRPAGLGRHAQASLQQGHAPEDGGDYRCLPNLVGLLRPADCVTAGRGLERRGSTDQFLLCRRLLSLRSSRKGRKRSSAGLTRKFGANSAYGSGC